MEGNSNELTIGNQYMAASSFAPCATIYFYIVAVDKEETGANSVVGVYFQTHIIPEFTILTVTVALLDLRLQQQPPITLPSFSKIYNFIF